MNTPTTYRPLQPLAGASAHRHAAWRRPTRVAPAALFAMLSLVLAICPVAADEGASAAVPLTLERAIATALSHHPQIGEADARKQQATAVNRDAHARADWQVKVEGRQVHLSEVPALSGFPAALRMPTIEFAKQDAAAAALTAQKVITSGRKIEAGIAQTRSAAQAATHAAVRVRQTVAFAAERDFLQLVLAQRERDVARQALETAEEYRRVARSRHEARSAAEFDVLRAEVQTEEARQDLIRANALIDTARAALAQTLAVTNEPWTASEDGLPASATLPPLADAVREALTSRPELAGAECGIRAAAAAVTAARAERRPTVAFVADYQHNDPETTTQINRWSAAVVAGVPVFDGGHGRAAVAAARAGVTQQEAAHTALRNQIEREVRQAHARVESAANQVAVAARRLQLAEEMLRIAHVRYATGISTVTEVADAQTSVTRARQGHVRALSDLRITEAELRLAMGTIAKEVQP